jgi:hypothetical protein
MATAHIIDRTLLDMDASSGMRQLSSTQLLASALYPRL